MMFLSGRSSSNSSSSSCGVRNVASDAAGTKPVNNLYKFPPQVTVTESEDTGHMSR